MRPAVPSRKDIRARRRCGLSLVELLVSMIIMSIIFLGMAGAVMVATRAIPTGDGPAENVDGAREVIGQIVEDLRVAINITERTPTAITFTLKDRDDDGLPEVMRYSWSGAAGASLVRKHNGVATDVLDDVHQFELGYVLKGVLEEYPGPLVTSSELELASHSVIVFSRRENVGFTQWCGQYFEPALPDDTISWEVTRVLFKAQYAGAPDGSFYVQLRPDDGYDLPTDTVLAQKTILESGLTNSYVWQDIPFSAVTELDPETGLCLVLEGVGDGNNAAIERDADDGSNFFYTIDSGTVWESDGDSDMSYYVYGRALLPGAAQTLTRDHVTTVKIGLRSGIDPAGLVKTSVQTLNLPEALDALWEADFNADPTLLDLNADDVPDWNVPGSFNTGYLSNGVWTADGDLDTNPGNNFTAPMTVDLRFRDVTDDNETGGIKLRFDRSGLSHAQIRAQLELNASGKQTLTILTYTGGFSLVSVLEVTGLSADFVDLRLLVDPDHDTCHVLVDGRDHGTFSYGHVTSLTSNTCELFESDTISGLRFDSVRIRVGGTN